ncbi:hypothetical protein [Ureibacillus acetophenoni]|uniref:Uncharacterized protein n=1 Tax=Ureibacillus acetophenoni TaxID=614649 RepID=A0A285UT19_9BACL|nr:hypothetical protein [Ureibacillus acetophenoni]SOC44959.1 hypothetical protein SAMN05877842_1264 [Ureibacillus acetophenoni]
MPNKEERKKIIEAIANSDEYFKDNDEALKDIEKAVEEVEAIKNGLLPKRPARELLKELDEKENLQLLDRFFRNQVDTAQRILFN